MRTRRIGFGLAIGLTMALAADTAATSYQRSIADWRAQREAKLKAEDGWLTVVGLTWLKEGTNRVGSDPNFEVRLPKSAPANVGMLTLKVRQGTLYTRSWRGGDDERLPRERDRSQA